MPTMILRKTPTRNRKIGNMRMWRPVKGKRKKEKLSCKQSKGVRLPASAQNKHTLKCLFRQLHIIK